MAQSLPNFADFVLNTGSAYMTGVNDVINEAQKQTFILKRLLKGRGNDEVVQGGKTIKDVIQFDEGGTYTHYDPNATFQWTNPQVTTEWEIPWRFSIAHMAWADQEVELQVVDGMSAEGVGQVYKRIKRVKEQAMWTDMFNGMENDLWRSATSAQDTMEGTVSGQVHLPYSFPAFITEDTTNYHAHGWTTVQGINPASVSGWRNRTSLYDYDDPDDSDGDRDGLINAFDDMFFQVQFQTPGTREEYFTSVDLSKQMICASRGGVNLYKQLLRDSNDRLVSPQDAAYNEPAYSGIPVTYISTLDTLSTAWNPVTSTSEATELAATTDGYRFWWINGRFIKPVFHSRRYMMQHDIKPHPNQPFTRVMPVDCWWNLALRKRTAVGIVAPQ